MPAACSASTISMNSAISGAGLAGVAGVRREVAESRVAPIVSAVGGEQAGFGGAGLHRQQFQRGHRQAFQVLDDGRVGDPLERAAQLRRDIRVQLGQADDVRLVDHRLFPGHPRPDRGRIVRRSGDRRRRPRRPAAPCPGCRHRSMRRRSGRTRSLVTCRAYGSSRIFDRIPRRHPESVHLTRADVRHEGVPDPVGAFVHRHAALGAVRGRSGRAATSETPGHAVGDDGEVGAALIRGGAQRVRQAGVGRRTRPAARPAGRPGPAGPVALPLPSSCGLVVWPPDDVNGAGIVQPAADRPIYSDAVGDAERGPPRTYPAGRSESVARLGIGDSPRRRAFPRTTVSNAQTVPCDVTGRGKPPGPA